MCGMVTWFQMFSIRFIQLTGLALNILKVTAGAQTGCPQHQYNDRGTCVVKCPGERPYIRDDTTCVDHCDDGWGAADAWDKHCTLCKPGVAVDGVCAMVCPEGMVHSERCISKLHIYLVLGSMMFLVAMFLLCCAVFYRIRCEFLCKLTRFCKTKVTKKDASTDHSALLKHEETPQPTDQDTAANNYVI